jgi:DNA-binding GntR family transcriptional regulator
MNNWVLNTNDVLKTRERFVTDQLRDAILKGYLKPGQKLDQGEIADLLKVSRSPVREALRTLAAEELVQVYPHRGAAVAEFSREELEEIYYLRGTLEGMAVRLAVSKMDEARIAKLKEILNNLDQVTDLDKWLDLNREFHNTIYEAVNRPRLISLIQHLRNISAHYTRQYIASPEFMKVTQEGHWHILEALIDGDGVRAQEETQEHLKVLCDGVLVCVDSILNSASKG